MATTLIKKEATNRKRAILEARELYLRYAKGDKPTSDEKLFLRSNGFITADPGPRADSQLAWKIDRVKAIEEVREQGYVNDGKYDDLKSRLATAKEKLPDEIKEQRAIALNANKNADEMEAELQAVINEDSMVEKARKMLLEDRFHEPEILDVCRSRWTEFNNTKGKQLRDLVSEEQEIKIAIKANDNMVDMPTNGPIGNIGEARHLLDVAKSAGATFRVDTGQGGGYRVVDQRKWKQYFEKCVDRLPEVQKQILELEKEKEQALEYANSPKTCWLQEKVTFEF